MSLFSPFDGLDIDRYAPQGVLGKRAAKRCLALAGVTVAAMGSLAESTSEAQAQSANVYTCPGAKVAYKDQPQKQFDTAVECVVNAERSERGLLVAQNHPTLGLAALRHSQDMTERGYFSHEEPEPSRYGKYWSNRVTLAAKEMNADIINSPRAFVDGGEVIFSSINTTLPKNVVEWYLKSSGHCDTIMRNVLLYQGSGTSEGSNNVINNTINLVDIQKDSPSPSSMQICGLNNIGLIANIQDPIYKPSVINPTLQVNLKTKKINTKKGKRLQVNIDVDDLKAPGGDKNHDTPIEKGTAVAIQIKRKVGNTAFKTVLRKTIKVDSKGRARTSVSVPRRTRWQIEVWHKLSTDKRFNSVAYARGGR